MSLQLVDGFDHYSDAQKIASGNWTSLSVPLGGAGTATVTGAIGRTSAAMRMHVGTSTADYARLLKTIGTPSGSTFIGQFALQYNTAPASPVVFFAPSDLGSYQTRLTLNIDGTISARRGSTVLGTTSVGLSTGIYYHIGYKVVLHASAGTVSIWVNGTQIINATGLNTSETGTTNWNGVYLAADNNGANNLALNIDFDDLVVMDGVDGTATQGAAFNAFLGDASAVVTMPTGDGHYTAFTVHSSSSHYQNVDDNPPNDDTDYNDGVNNGDRDSYTFPIPSTQTILALIPAPYAKETASASRSYKLFVRASSTDYDNATAQNLGTSYLFYPQVYGVDPSTSLPWAGGSTEIGLKVQS